MPEKTLYLYTTLGCHLCEGAEKIMTECLSMDFFRIEKVEIADSDDMIEKYGTRIPVIRLESSSQDLGWPFDHQQLIDFLTEELERTSPST